MVLLSVGAEHSKGSIAQFSNHRLTVMKTVNLIFFQIVLLQELFLLLVGEHTMLWLQSMLSDVDKQIRNLSNVWRQGTNTTLQIGDQTNE